MGLEHSPCDRLVVLEQRFGDLEHRFDEYRGHVVRAISRLEKNLAQSTADLLSAHQADTQARLAAIITAVESLTIQIRTTSAVAEAGLQRASVATIDLESHRLSTRAGRRQGWRDAGWLAGAITALGGAVAAVLTAMQ